MLIFKARVYNYHFDNLFKAKTLETKHILIDKKNYKDLTIYFRYVHSKTIKMLSLHYHHELVGKVEVHGEKNI